MVTIKDQVFKLIASRKLLHTALLFSLITVIIFSCKKTPPINDAGPILHTIVLPCTDLKLNQVVSLPDSTIVIVMQGASANTIYFFKYNNKMQLVDSSQYITSKKIDFFYDKIIVRGDNFCLFLNHNNEMYEFSSNLELIQKNETINQDIGIKYHSSSYPKACLGPDQTILFANDDVIIDTGANKNKFVLACFGKDLTKPLWKTDTLTPVPRNPNFFNICYFKGKLHINGTVFTNPSFSVCFRRIYNWSAGYLIYKEDVSQNFCGEYTFLDSTLFWTGSLTIDNEDGSFTKNPGLSASTLYKNSLNGYTIFKNNLTYDGGPPTTKCSIKNISKDFQVLKEYTPPINNNYSNALGSFSDGTWLFASGFKDENGSMKISITKLSKDLEEM